jgi:hypothetical protein
MFSIAANILSQVFLTSIGITLLPLTPNTRAILQVKHPYAVTSFLIIGYARFESQNAGKLLK